MLVNIIDIAAHEIAKSLSEEKSRALAVFHAFTGSYVTSFFAGKSKKSTWNTWNAYPNITEAFLTLTNSPTRISGSTMRIVAKFVVLWFDRTSEMSKVNDVRQYLFSRKSRNLEYIRPTFAALQQHTLRAVYQGGHAWDKPCLNL